MLPFIQGFDSSAPYGADHFIEFNTATFSSFSLAGGAGALPLRFISFLAERGSNGILLRWSVEKQEIIKLFHVEYSSDGRNFKTIGSANKNDFSGSSPTEWNYEYLDRSIYNGNAFYRIKMVDINGIEKYSSIQIIASLSLIPGTISVFPNPANQFIIVQADRQYGLTEFQLFNACGSRIKQGRLILNQNGSTLIDVQDLPRGSYAIQISVIKSGATHSFRFVRN